MQHRPLAVFEVPVLRVLFLDIDGVLNHYNTYDGCQPGRIPVAPECMARLNNLVERSGAKVVISSSWRKFAAWTELAPALAREGLVAEVIGETPDLINDPVWLAEWKSRNGTFYYERLERGHEIRQWLADHPEVEEFVILDDGNDMGVLLPWLVLTDPLHGLQYRDIDVALGLFPHSRTAPRRSPIVDP